MSVRDVQQGLAAVVNEYKRSLRYGTEALTFDFLPLTTVWLEFREYIPP